MVPKALAENVVSVGNKVYRANMEFRVLMVNMENADHKENVVSEVNVVFKANGDLTGYAEKTENQANKDRRVNREKEEKTESLEFLDPFFMIHLPKFCRSVTSG